RLWVTTGTEVRAYDLATRALIVAIAVPGASAIAVDGVHHRVLVGDDQGQLRTIDTTPLDEVRRTGADAAGSISAREFMALDAPVQRLHVSGDGAAIVAITGSARAPSVAVVVIDAAAATETARLDLPSVAQLDDAGAGLVAAATPTGVAFIDTVAGTLTTTIAIDGPVHGIALVTNIDKDKLYASYDGPNGPRVAVLDAPGTGTAPTLKSSFELPGDTAGWVGYDAATQMVHVLGDRPDGSGATVYVVEPHADSVYEDAALPFEPTAIVLDQNQRYPSNDREQLLALDATGTTASVPIGQHAFAWRLPGVIAGVLMAVLLYLLARLLFRRREVAVFLAILIALDGMLFAQSRIGMNDAYVGLGIVAAYTLFAALWRSPGSRRRDWIAFALLMPLIGACLGFALASKWVAAYAIGALGILVLSRSALGRLLLIAGLVLITTALGYLAISVPPGQTGGNYLFLFMMVGLTLAAVAAIVIHPVAWSWEEQRLAIRGPAVLGAAIFLIAIATHRTESRLTLGGLAVTPMELAFGLVVLSAAIYSACVVVGRRGFGPLAVAPPRDDPASLLEPAAAAPAGWLRPGAAYGLPLAWTVLCLVVLPVALYVVSYLPWAAVENHRIVPGWPGGHTGQTLLDLTQEMYKYHNTLSSAHAASSPWWAWIFDFKPVWFYQESFAGGTSAAIYDAGNLIAWWLAIPAMAFAAWQAFARRNAALALVTIAFACQWIAWARIDRAAFQYHYYTSLPFVFLALAYFLAELWRGASRRTWLLARLAAAAAVLAPTALWLFHRPLCGFVRVTDVNPGSRACPTVIPDFVLSGRALAIAIVVGIGVLLVVRLLLSLAADAEEESGGGGRGERNGRGILGRLGIAVGAAVGVSIAFVVASVFFQETSIVTWVNVPVEPIALVVTLALLPIAAFVASARDARRFVVGVVLAIAGWFVIWYPNFAALPLPAALSNAYQGLLPTYVYPFQFPVSTIDRNVAGPSLIAPGPALLAATIVAVCLAVGYAAWVWRITVAERAYLDSRPLEDESTTLPEFPG
ncbi:MAG: phospholipid carrier-dependent glycosyltransferase, partial [Candidatus Limnocylindrales bacterium]